MDGDRRCALIIRAGCPRRLNYRRNARGHLGDVREFLVYHLIEEARHIEVYRALSYQKSALQGYPGQAVNTEFVSQVRARAIQGVQDFGKALLPWENWPTPEEVEKARGNELVSGSVDMVRAWIAHFDPENLDTGKYEIPGGPVA